VCSGVECVVEGESDREADGYAEYGGVLYEGVSEPAGGARGGSGRGSDGVWSDWGFGGDQRGVGERGIEKMEEKRRERRTWVGNNHRFYLLLLVSICLAFFFVIKVDLIYWSDSFWLSFATGLKSVRSFCVDLIRLFDLDLLHIYIGFVAGIDFPCKLEIDGKKT